MGQVDVTGKDALAYLQYLTPNDVSTLGPAQAHYSLLPNKQGGVVDDIIIYRRPSGNGYMVVINAANRAKDVAWMQQIRAERSDLDVTVEDISDRTGMIAIQGPRAIEIVQSLTTTDLSKSRTFPGSSWTSPASTPSPVIPDTPARTVSNSSPKRATFCRCGMR